jgi:hypothetical protein
MDREAQPTKLPSRFLKRLPHAAALAAVVGAGTQLTGTSGCSHTTSSDGVGAGVGAIVFVQRQTTTVDQNGTVNIDVAGGNGQVIDYQRYVPGGRLMLLSPARPDGTLTNLTSDFPTADFNGADLSFDATQVVFSMKKDGNDRYHIYTVSLAPSANGKYEVHQKTAGDYDDITPIFAPGDKIAFATNQMYTQMGTRADEYNHSRVASQLASVTVLGGDADRRLFAQSLSHSLALFMRADGRIGYSRWEHLGGVNDVKLFTVNPDGTGMFAVGGQHGKPANSLINVREMLPNVMVGIATDRERTIHSGALVMIDSRNQNDPVCLDPNANYTGHVCLDEEHTQFTILTPDVPTGSDPSPVGRYREPSGLPDRRVLVSWASGPVNDQNEQSLTPPDYGIYVYDTVTHTNQLVYNDRTMWDLNALAVVARAEPPVIGDVQHVADETLPVRLGSLNVHTTSLDESVSGAQLNGVPLGQALQGAVGVRVVEGFSSEAAKGVTMFGLTMDEGAAVLGTAPVYPDGSWLANIPPYIPVHLQPIDKFGLSIRNQRLWIQGVANEDRRCVGCHESRTGQAVPAFGQNPTVAEQRGPESFTEAIPDRAEYPWDLKVQPVFDAKCINCHNSSTTSYYQITHTDPVTGNSTTYNVPTLDLTSAPVTVYYDRQVHAWPASYVSLFYPAALEMGKVTVTGTVPPKWGIPEDARNSALIEKINVHAADGSTAYDLTTSLSWKPGTLHAFHPADVGATDLTDDERQMLIRTCDLGGQYYSRQNTGFVPVSAASDPVSQ